MAKNSPELMVRRHQRHQCSVAATLNVADEDRTKVQLAKSVLEMGGLPVVVVDLSIGGAGIQSGVFLPRGCEVVLRLASSDGRDDPDRPAQKVRMRVQRVSMIDRAPTYYIGGRFVGLSDEDRESLERYIESMGADASAGGGAIGRA